MADSQPPPDGDVNKGPMLNAIAWTECCLALLLVLARIFTRTRLIKRWGWDDALMCLAMACASINTICVTICVHYGTGRHGFYLNDHQKVQANKFNWISQGFHVMSTNWGKVSVAFFLIRIVGKPKRTKYAFYAGMVLLTLVNSACVYTIYGQCTPTTALWTGVGPGLGSCWNPTIQRDYAFFQGSFSALSDFVLALYPVFIIWNLQMARKLKAGLTCVLALGVIATAAAVVKTIYLAELTAREDYTFDTVNLTTWINTEQYLIIIAACIPTLGPLYSVARGRTPSAAKRTSYNPRYIKASGPNNSAGYRRGRGRGSIGFGSRKKGSELETYTLDEYGQFDGAWSGPSPAEEEGRCRSSGHDSEELIVQPTMAVTAEKDGNYFLGGAPGGIIKTTEVHVESDSRDVALARRDRHGGSMSNVLLPWEPPITS